MWFYIFEVRSFHIGPPITQRKKKTKKGERKNQDFQFLFICLFYNFIIKVLKTFDLYFKY